MNQNCKDFSCPCGKSYLSYPALHTHIKRKHDGKAPGRLSVPKKTIKRGRPAIEMHKVLPSEKTQELEVLNMLEAAIVEVSDIYTSGCILQRNEQPELCFGEAHPYFHDTKPKSDMAAAMLEFTQDFCMHFKPDVTRRIVYFLSCLFYWLERTGQTFEVGLLERFFKGGYEEESRAKKLEYFHDAKDLKLFKLLALTLSKWLFANGHSTEVLELNE